MVTLPSCVTFASIDKLATSGQPSFVSSGGTRHQEERRLAEVIFACRQRDHVICPFYSSYERWLLHVANQVRRPQRLRPIRPIPRTELLADIAGVVGGRDGLHDRRVVELLRLVELVAAGYQKLACIALLGQPSESCFDGPVSHEAVVVPTAS